MKSPLLHHSPQYDQITWRMDHPPQNPPARSFLPLLRAAVAACPDRPDLLRDLAVALRDDQQWTEICDLLSPYVQGGQLTPALACELAQAAIACNDPALALRVLDPAVVGTRRAACQQRVLALYDLNRIDEARAAAVQFLDAHPEDSTVLDAFANDCLTRGAADALITLCQRAIDNGVASTLHLAYLSAAFSLADRTADVLQLVDPALLCRRIEIDCGLVDNQALAQAILTHPALAPSPEIRPTRGRNLRLDGLARIEHPAIRNLLALIRQQVDQYLAERFDKPHPLIAHRPLTAELRGWALVLSDDGHEQIHIHPKGWLSVIYYIRIPRCASLDAPLEAPAGALVFGPWPPAIGACLPDFPRWHMEPLEGTLLIFPSFLGHGTVPTDVGALRICVALDVIPCDRIPAAELSSMG